MLRRTRHYIETTNTKQATAEEAKKFETNGEVKILTRAEIDMLIEAGEVSPDSPVLEMNQDTVWFENKKVKEYERLAQESRRGLHAGVEEDIDGWNPMY